MKDERFFVCTGRPKSGTTYLQRSLNLHPDISCPSEQSFHEILAFVGQFALNYNKLLETIDRRTGGQGATTIDQKAAQQVAGTIITTLSREFAGTVAIHGLNDNFLFYNLPLFDNLLGQPRIIVIFRNPVDVAISTWRHNRRLAQEEPGNREMHLNLLSNPEHNLDGYVRLTGQQFGPMVERYLDYAQGRSNILTVLYEQMVADTARELKRIFRFLGADDSDEIIQGIVVASSKEEMAKNSQYPAFFGIDRKPGESDRVSPSVRSEVLQANAKVLEMLGYGVSALIGLA